MKRILKYSLLMLFIVFILYGLYIISGYLAFLGFFDKQYSVKDAIENYDKREKEISELVTYFNSHLPPDRHVIFGCGQIGRLLMWVGPLQERMSDPAIGGKNLRLNSSKMDTVLKILGWTNQTVDTLEEKLKKSNCESIANNDPTQIYIASSRYATYTYLIYNKPLTDSMIAFYNDKSGTTVIRKNVVIKSYWGY